MSKRHVLVFVQICLICFLVFPIAKADELRFPDQPLAGAWAYEDGYYVITYWGGSPYLIDSRNGLGKHLTEGEDNVFSYGPARSVDEPVVGTLKLVGDQLIAGAEGEPLPSADRILFDATEFTAQNGDDATLSGTLILPQDGKPKAVILFLDGEGPNERTGLFPTALSLVVEGYGVAVFDQRNIGGSEGVKVTGLYYERSMVAAADALAVLHTVEGNPKLAGVPIGVAGWSQGGWLGAVIANRDSNVAFYINIAGNSSPGWLQWRHAMTTWLYRKGVEDDQIARANAYFDAFFGVMLGSTAWDVYTEALETAQTEAWFPVMRQRYTAEWDSTDEAAEFYEKEYSREPGDDYKDLAIPTLGIFFQFDHSTTPQSPEDFLAGVQASKSPEVRVVVLPGLNHGSWGPYQSYRTPSSEVTFRSVRVNEVLKAWLDEIVSGKP